MLLGKDTRKPPAVDCSDVAGRSSIKHLFQVTQITGRAVVGF
jgi:hypothetical protein